MNDFSEIEHGLGCLRASYRGPTGNSFKKLLDEMFPEVSIEAEKLFDGWTPHFRSETYITCVSEHLDSEDVTGRLSMWRAYGGSSGVALVFNNAPFLGSTQVLGAYSSPVEYLREAEFDDAFKEVVASIEREKSIVSQLDRSVVVAHVFNMLRHAVLCTKHPGFAEEREWRVIHAPNLYGPGKVVHDYQAIGGVPQSVYKIPLKDWPDEGLVGVAIPSFLNRLIIGPAQLPGTLYSTFHKVLAEAGVTDIEKKLCISDIPLRR
jgi:hypothetical protein